MIPALTVRDIRLAERTVTFQRPFRFGSTTVTSAPQVFVHAEIKIDGRTSFGATAELMVPKWFDKNPAISIEETRNGLTKIRQFRSKKRSKNCGSPWFSRGNYILSSALHCQHSRCMRPFIRTNSRLVPAWGCPSWLHFSAQPK